MKLIICVDDNMGVLFNHRRQSQDRVLRTHLLELTADSVLWMRPYTARQFGEPLAPQISVSENCLNLAGENEWCFAELGEVQEYADRIQELWLYRWNRTYPADHQLDLSLADWTLLRSTEFEGYSHPTITEEVYTK